MFHCNRSIEKKYILGSTKVALTGEVRISNSHPAGRSHLLAYVSQVLICVHKQSNKIQTEQSLYPICILRRR